MLSGWTAEPHVGMPSLLGLTVGSHQGCGLWAKVSVLEGTGEPWRVLGREGTR